MQPYRVAIYERASETPLATLKTFIVFADSERDAIEITARVRNYATHEIESWGVFEFQRGMIFKG